MTTAKEGDVLTVRSKEKLSHWDLLGGPVVGNPPANTGDMGSSPGSGEFHMVWDNKACALEALAPEQEATTMKPKLHNQRASPLAATRESPGIATETQHSPKVNYIKKKKKKRQPRSMPLQENEVWHLKISERVNYVSQVRYYSQRKLHLFLRKHLHLPVGWHTQDKLF